MKEGTIEKHLKRMTVLVVVISLVILGAGGVVTLSLNRVRQEGIDNRIQGEVESYKEELEQKVQTDFQIVYTLAAFLEFNQGLDKENFSRGLLESNNHNNFVRMGYFSKNGRGVRVTRGKDMETDVTLEEISPRIHEIVQASIMHDVGKIAISDLILNKPGKLTDEEFEIMKGHTVMGCQVLEQIPQYKKNRLYQYAYDICRHHHERWDGKGYPDGLKGREITVWAQVVSVADVFDALTNKRVYKPAIPVPEAMDMIFTGQCGAFNPELLEALEKILPQIEGKI